MVAISSAAEIPFPADITNRQNQLVRTGREEVVVIAAHGARRAAEAMHFERLQIRNLPRKQLRLHFLCNGQFAFQPLLFLLLQNQLLDRFSHGVERHRELRQLVGGLDRNTMTEVAAIHMLGSVIELRHGTRHRPRHARSDNQSDQYNQGEEDE